jgi:hypothetical protein
MMLELTLAPEPVGALSGDELRGQPVVVENYIGTAAKRQRGPQAFRIDLPPGHVINPHFHRSDQYQVFIGGHAMYGDKYDLDPVTVHYADKYSPYGPLIAGDDGYTMFNLRAHAETGAYYMPGSRDKIEMRGGRHITVRNRHGIDHATDTSMVEALVEPHPDGLAVDEIVAGPGCAIGNRLAVGSGCFQLVIDGELELEGVTLGKRSVAFAPAGQRFAARRAGPAGVHFLELQFPVA